MLVHITVQIGKFDRNINKKEKIRIIRKSCLSNFLVNQMSAIVALRIC